MVQSILLPGCASLLVQVFAVTETAVGEVMFATVKDWGVLSVKGAKREETGEFYSSPIHQIISESQLKNLSIKLQDTNIISHRNHQNLTGSYITCQR